MQARGERQTGVASRRPFCREGGRLLKAIHYACKIAAAGRAAESSGPPCTGAIPIPLRTHLDGASADGHLLGVREATDQAARRRCHHDGVAGFLRFLPPRFPLPFALTPSCCLPSCALPPASVLHAPHGLAPPIPQGQAQTKGTRVGGGKAGEAHSDAAGHEPTEDTLASNKRTCAVSE